MIGTSRSVWGFDPRSVPGCQLWLDGADSNTVTGTTSVTAWRDKSANGYVANSFVNSVPNPSWVPNVRNGNGVIQYSAGNGSSIANFVLAQTMSIFKVYYPINQSIGSPFIEQGPNAGSESGFFFHSQNDNNFYIRAGSIGLANFGTTTVSNTWQMIEGINPDPANGNRVAFYVNGITRASGGTQSDTTTVTKTLYINGRAGTSSVSYNTYLAELIIYNIAVTTTQRQQIEGYLAHKWGLTGYYDSSIPLTIPGCQLWLDGADQSSMTLSGSSVTQWNDKSGNGYHMNTLSASALWTGSAVYPTIGTSMNGLQTVNFVAQSGLKQATTLDGIKNLFWVGRIAAPTGSPSGPGAPVYFLLGHDTLYDWHATSYGGKFIETAFAQAGISSATASLFTSDPNAVTNATFSTVNMPSAPNISLLSVSGITGSTRYQGICYDRGFHTGWCGDLAEVITFTTALTTTQRQTIEGYLSKKWGIGSSSSIPSTHPFSSIRPHLRTFQPIDVPGCALWLDGADTSSMTLSGSNVTQWNDKSGNGANGTAVGTTPTIASGGGITFSAGAYNTSYSSSLTNESLFVVFGYTRTSGTLSLVGQTGDGARLLSLGAGASTAQLQSSVYNVALGALSPTTTVPINTIGLGELITTNSTMAIFYNGTSVGTPTAVTITSGRTSIIGGASSGGSINASQYFGGIIYEVIGFTSALTTSQRQQVEGYLAHKWGLTLSLPVISPLSIPGCQLWFDAADSSTVAFSSGSNVSSWTNKGTVSTTATPTRGPSANQITYVTVDGYPGVYINNNGSIQYNASTYSQLTIQSNFQNTEDYSVFAVVNLSNVTNASLQTIYGNERGTSGETRSPNFGAGQLLEFNAAGGSRVIDLSFIGSGRLQTALISSSSALTAYTNATAYGSNTNGFTRFSTDAGPLPRIGGAFGSINDPRFATGYFHEILFYNSALTTSQRQQIEGYLARKWGISISATLPSPHPFKSFPPASLHFDPSTKYSALFNNSHLSIPANAALTLGTNNHTIEFWMYQITRGQYDVPFAYGNMQPQTATTNYYMNAGSAGFGIGIGNGAGGWAVQLNGTLASLNAWHHYAIVRNGNVFTVYINGISQSSVTRSITIPAQGDVFRIGSDGNDGLSGGSGGYITNFRVVNGTAVYTSNFIPSTSPLTAIPNTQILVQGLTDRSPNAFTVTNNGGVTLSTLSPFPPP